jgi:bifunctional NMN adenylyltransferase/nudix hydrolase
MTKKKYDLAIYIGRFQPFHNGHLKVIEEAKKIAKEVLILVGSANASLSAKNPWRYDERAHMIQDTLGIDNWVLAEGLDDFIYEENQWLAEVQEIVASHKANKICIIGHSKDETSYYLKNFPQWDLIDVEYHEVIDATQIRSLMFEGKISFIKGAVPETIFGNILEFMSTDRFQNNLLEEYEFIVDYKKEWGEGPHQTVDAVVVQSGHILLIKRGEMPGKGLWALPGGFLKKGETLLDSCIRELREETRVKVPEPVLRGSIKKAETFDDPNRSQRGRIITRAFLIQLDNSQALPKVKGSDDAAHAEWVPLAEFYNMPEEMYEDHYHIVRKLLDNM